MGDVVAVQDLHVGREVAVKRLRSPSDATAKHRFFREAQIQARLDHPSIVPVYDIGTDKEGRPFFIMKRVRGTTLAELLHGLGVVTRTRHQLLRAFVDVCMAIEFAHARGVIHRDIKPHNLVLGDYGEVYVLDWGVAKIIGEPDPVFADHVATLTGVGVMVGTPGYMPPEQVRCDRSIDESADVYSLGCVLFEILTGSMLHPKGKAGLYSAASGDVDRRPSSRAGDVPPELDDACFLATSERALRPTARELADMVQRYLDGDRDVMHRRRLAREHVARARAAFDDANDLQSRRIAMREAGRALALDPELAEAADLLGRLMLEIPDRVPRDVETALEADSETATRRQARTSMLLSLAYFAFVPFLLGHGGSNLYASVFSLMALGNTLLTWRRACGSTNPFASSPILVALRNALIVGMVGAAFSPIVVGPGLAAVTTLMLLITPVFSRPAPIIMLVGAMVLAVLLPWFIEVIGWIPSTSTITELGLVINPDIVGSAGLRTAAWILFVLGLIGSASAIALVVRRSENEMRRRLHLRAWHLRQLVPER